MANGLCNKTLVGLPAFLVACLIFPGPGCAETPFVPFKAPSLNTVQWLTSNGPQQTDLIGRPYVIEFWATWCGACRESVKHMANLQNKYGSKGLIIVTFAQDRSASDVRAFMADKRINYHVALDTGLSAEYSLKHIPTVFVVDCHGQVIWRGFPWDAELQKTVEKVIDESSPPITGGVNLGPYERFKTELKGGPGFATVYFQIKADSQKPDNPHSAIARTIITVIDTNIARRINQARSLRYSNPPSAYHIYAELVKNYGGVPPTKPAVEALAAMKAGQEVRPEMYARSG